MTAFMNRHADLLGLESAAAPKAIASRSPVLTWMISACLVMGVFGGLVGTYVDYKEAERVEIAKQEAQKAAEEKAKNRERDAKIEKIHALAQRYQYELERDRKRIAGTIENVESYREKIPQVKRFLTEYQLPEEVDSAIRQPVDLTEATMSDTHDLQVKNIAEPTNLKAKYAKWRELLAAAGRYAEGIDRNNSYFNGYLREMRIEEQFKREFGKKPMQQAPAAQPQAESAPVQPAEPVVEQGVAEPAAPVVEAKPSGLAPLPKPRAVEPAKPKTVPAGSGRVQVTDW